MKYVAVVNFSGDRNGPIGGGAEGPLWGLAGNVAYFRVGRRHAACDVEGVHPAENFWLVIFFVKRFRGSPGLFFE